MPNRPHRPAGLTFDQVLTTIQETHRYWLGQALRAIHASLTLRNWLMGYSIENYERLGQDRSPHGERLMDDLADALRHRGLEGCDRRELYRYRQFYLCYPQIADAIPPELLPTRPPGKDAASAKTRPAPAPRWPSGKTLVEQLSFAHLAELIAIENPRKRAFYESESLRRHWSAHKLRHQIASLDYELSGLAKDRPPDPEPALASAPEEAPAVLREPRIFEFLGLRSREVVGESATEEQWLDLLQNFLLDLGYGLCFEARQKHLLIGDSHYFIDLVFYHRILKCHVLVEFQPAEFSHETLTQLSAGVVWYRERVMTGSDQPPVGMLLHAHPQRARVEYALAGLDQHVFASRYQPALPGDQELQRFLAQAATLLN